jgi:hypothetical protein
MLTEHEVAEKKLKRKQMLSLYKKALCSIASANTHNLNINLEARFRPDSLDFEITGIDNNYDNATVYFDDFMSEEQLTTLLNGTINIIKTDNFLIFKDWAFDK